MSCTFSFTVSTEVRLIVALKLLVNLLFNLNDQNNCTDFQILVKYGVFIITDSRKMHVADQTTGNGNEMLQALAPHIMHVCS